MPWRWMGEWRFSSIFLDLCTTWRWVVSFTPLPLYPGERTSCIHWTGGSVGPRFGLDAVEKRKILHCRESKRGLPARRCTYWAIPAPVFNIMVIANFDQLSCVWIFLMMVWHSRKKLRVKPGKLLTKLCSSLKSPTCFPIAYSSTIVVSSGFNCCIQRGQDAPRARSPLQAARAVRPSADVTLRDQAIIHAKLIGIAVPACGAHPLGDLRDGLLPRLEYRCVRTLNQFPKQDDAWLHSI
jgi:hypothetical protein